MTFEVGKCYRMRSGDIAFITEVLPDIVAGEYTVRGRVAFTGALETWTERGQWDTSSATDPRDLVPQALECDPARLEKRVADLELQVKELIRARDGSHVVR